MILMKKLLVLVGIVALLQTPMQAHAAAVVNVISNISVGGFPIAGGVDATA